MAAQKRLLYLLFLLFPFCLAAKTNQLTVAANGKGDFKTIQAAVNSLPDSATVDRVIFIKKGTYNEQVLVTKPHIMLQGESREETIITGSIAHVIASCTHPENKYTGIFNLEGDDITIQNLTIENTYGLNARDTVQMDCFDKETNGVKKVVINKNAHQFALRSFKSTRLKVIHCTIRNWGADAVSPWNAQTGMYYFKDCILQGGTDFYCPRGWAYAEGCTFICNTPGAAAIWHDGHANPKMKSVLKNCHFQGSAPYKLGRYHHDAQFYLINCTFDKNLADLPIYKAGTAKEVFWGSRTYYDHCSKEGSAYSWLTNNLETSAEKPTPETINAQWTFDGQWNPEHK